jgi:hypothetical protein
MAAAIRLPDFLLTMWVFEKARCQALIGFRQFAIGDALQATAHTTGRCFAVRLNAGIGNGACLNGYGLRG